MAKIIDKNTPLPCSDKRRFANSSDYMSSVRRRGRLPKIEVVDLFCGTGGLSYGMKSRGLHILSGYDIDPTCKYAYETNNGAKFQFKDIRDVKGDNSGPNFSDRRM